MSSSSFWVCLLHNLYCLFYVLQYRVLEIFHRAVVLYLVTATTLYHPPAVFGVSFFCRLFFVILSYGSDMFLCTEPCVLDKFSLIFILSLPFVAFNFILAPTSFPSSKDMPFIGRLSITPTIIGPVLHFDLSSTSHRGISIFFPPIPLTVIFFLHDFSHPTWHFFF